MEAKPGAPELPRCKGQKQQEINPWRRFANEHRDSGGVVLESQGAVKFHKTRGLGEFREGMDHKLGVV